MWRRIAKKKMSDRFEEKETNSGHLQSHAFPLGLQYTVKSLDIWGPDNLYLPGSSENIHLVLSPSKPFLQFPENGLFQGGPWIHL